jgi:hypothetical protein
MYEYVDGEFRVATVGGGGERSQPQADYSKPTKVPFYSAEEEELKPGQHGFVHAHIDPKTGYKVTNAYYHCDGSILQFSGINRTDKAETENPDITTFRNTVLDACEECFTKNPYKPEGWTATAQRLPVNGFFGVTAALRSFAEWGTPLDDFRKIAKLCRELNCLAAEEIHTKKAVELQRYISAVIKTVTSLSVLPSATTFTVFLDTHFQKKYGMSYTDYINKFSKPEVLATSSDPESKEIVSPGSPSQKEIKESGEKSPPGSNAPFSAEEDITAKLLLRDIIRSACDEYKAGLEKLTSPPPGGLLSMISSFSLWSHGDEGIERMNKLKEYFSKPEFTTATFKDVLSFVKTALLYTGIPSATSLIEFVKKRFKTNFNIEYNEFLKSPRLILQHTELLTAGFSPKAVSNPRPIPRPLMTPSSPRMYKPSPLSCSAEARSADRGELGGDLILISPQALGAVI